jgi:spermidine/putrescine transport system ATP-binding protein
MSMALSIESVVKTFRQTKDTVHAVDNISLDIRQNEFFTLLGPSGCGKTTLLRMIAGLETVDEGKIFLDGQDITALPAHLRPVNTVFQNYALFPHMTVGENISFGLKMHGKVDASLHPEIVRNILSVMHMDGMEDRMPSELSGGQQQRVALARALVNHPKVLLLDESLSALDSKLRKEMQVELKRLQRETGITFVFVTHDQDEAMSMSDRIAILDKGKIVQMGAPRDVYDMPMNRFVATFLGECNFIKAKTIGSTNDGEIGFRPEDALLYAQPPRQDSLRIDLPGRVKHVQYQGANIQYIVRLLSDENVTVNSPSRFPLANGSAVTVSIDMSRLIRCAA